MTKVKTLLSVSTKLEDYDINAGKSRPGMGTIMCNPIFPFSFFKRRQILFKHILIKGESMINQECMHVKFPRNLCMFVGRRGGGGRGGGRGGG